MHSVYYALLSKFYLSQVEIHGSRMCSVPCATVVYIANFMRLIIIECVLNAIWWDIIFRRAEYKCAQVCLNVYGMQCVCALLCSVERIFHTLDKIDYGPLARHCELHWIMYHFLVLSCFRTLITLRCYRSTLTVLFDPPARMNTVLFARYASSSFTSQQM